MTLMLKRDVTLKRSVLLKRGRSDLVTGQDLGSRRGRLLRMWPGQGLGCIPATPIELSLAEQPTLARDSRESQDARQTDNRSFAVVFPLKSSGVPAMHGRRRVGRKLRRRPKFPLDSLAHLVNETRPTRLLPDGCRYRAEERRSQSGIDRRRQGEQQVHFFGGEAEWHGRAPGVGSPLMTPCAPRLQGVDVGRSKSSRRWRWRACRLVLISACRSLLGLY
jgi:hypothetical protein